MPRILRHGLSQQAQPAQAIKTTTPTSHAPVGQDADFVKKAQRLAPVDTVPFYGMKTTAASYRPRRHPKIGTDLNAIDVQDNPIETSLTPKRASFLSYTDICSHFGIFCRFLSALFHNGHTLKKEALDG